MMFTTSFPGKLFYPDLQWAVKTDNKEIYLTFDDGPNPEITGKVLDILDQFDARATFFCVGQNVEKFPDVYHEILLRKNQAGNHTYNHLVGWKTSNNEYVEKIEKCRQLVDSRLFRPPHGKIKRSQIGLLKKEYTIVMWSVLTYDFSKTISAGQCLQIALKHTRPGSIVVFHDSEKALRNMQFALPRFLEHFKNKGFHFKTLTA
jgi:peptidoglycan/xylan/chitin deacetylase (PgdA/CDA1 family)